MPVKAGVAIARGSDPAKALAAAVEEARGRARVDGAPDLLFAVSVGHAAKSLESALAETQVHLQAREAVAVTAASVLTSGPVDEEEQKPSVGVMVLHGDPGLSVWSGRTRRPAWNTQPMVLLSDPETSISVPVRALQEGWDPLRSAGGAAASVDGSAAVIHHGPGPVGFAAMALHAASVEVSVAQGCALVGHVMDVTSSDGNLLLTLDGKRALDAVLEQLPAKDRKDPARALSRTMLAVTPPGAERDDLAHGRFFVRPIIGVAPDVGALAVGENVRPGSRVCLCRRDGKHAERALRGALTQLRMKLSGAAPVAGLFFTCAGRGRALYGRSLVEAELIGSALGRVPVLGMASSFELGPLAPSGAQVHMYSGVLLVLAEGN